jgi:branched-subunit amino acid aminotransferase/4-amino-4-deoxychorismate lyase
VVLRVNVLFASVSLVSGITSTVRRVFSSFCVQAVIRSCTCFNSRTFTRFPPQCFEGMKAYKDREGKIRLFRPEKNMARLNHSMTRLAMPSFNGEGFLECLKALLQLDSSWIPDQEGYSMYIRPTAIGTSPYLGVEAAQHVKLYAILSPVGPYYRSGFKPVKLYADTVHTRAWPGGVGNAKVRRLISLECVYGMQICVT